MPRAHAPDFDGDSNAVRSADVATTDAGLSVCEL
jgi:hypothetical protein